MTLYDRLGGQAGVRAVVDDFYDEAVADERLGDYFDGADVSELRRAQTDYLCEAAGGPETYDSAPVHDAHADVPLDKGDISRAVSILRQTLEEHGVGDEDAAQVIEAIAVQEEALTGNGAEDV